MPSVDTSFYSNESLDSSHKDTESMIYLKSWAEFPERVMKLSHIESIPSSFSMNSSHLWSETRNYDRFPRSHRVLVIQVVMN